MTRTVAESKKVVTPWFFLTHSKGAILKKEIGKGNHKWYVSFLRIESCIGQIWSVHQSNWLLVRMTWATWSALHFFHVAQDSSGMLTYDESILAAFGSQRNCTPIWRYSSGPRWFPIIKGYSRFQLTACLTENEDARIHFAKKIIIIIIITIFMIQLFCFSNVCTYLEFYHSRSRWFSGWKDHQGYFCRPGGAIRPPMANSCLCMPLASDTRMLSPPKDHLQFVWWLTKRWLWMDLTNIN